MFVSNKNDGISESLQLSMHGGVFLLARSNGVPWSLLVRKPFGATGSRGNKEASLWLSYEDKSSFV